MRSDLDGRFAAAVAAVTGPGGPLAVAPGSADGMAVVADAPATLGAFFDHFCAAHGQGEAIVAGAERLDYVALADASDRVARALAGGWGIVKGDRVGLAMRNCPAWIILYMAIGKAGGIATLVNGWWQCDELAHGIALTTPRLIVADAERARRIAATGHAGPVVVLDVEAPLETALAPLIDGVAAGPLPVVTPDDDAHLLFTSGSTGPSKGAVSTHRAVTTAAYCFLAYTASLLKVMVDEGRPPENPPAALLAVPLFHVTGTVPVLLNSIAIGRKLVMMRKWDAGEALRLIAAERVTYFIGVPTMSLELMQHPDRDRHDTRSLIDIGAGGAARPVAHVARLIAAFPHGSPLLGYGLTETNAVGSTNFRANYAARPASTGTAQAPFVDIAIFDPAGLRVAAGETGEIGIRSRANFRGYWQDPAATAAAVQDGYVRTGDIGCLDADGYLFIVDRAKDIIIRGGENISCQEVEAAIYAHPAVAEATVFGVPDERLGEVPVAMVVPIAGGKLTAADLHEALAGRLARFKVPGRILVSSDPLPKLGTGKVDKRAARAAYLAREPVPA